MSFSICAKGHWINRINEPLRLIEERWLYNNYYYVCCQSEKWTIWRLPHLRVKAIAFSWVLMIWLKPRQFLRGDLRHSLLMKNYNTYLYNYLSLESTFYSSDECDGMFSFYSSHFIAQEVDNRIFRVELQIADKCRWEVDSNNRPQYLERNDLTSICAAHYLNSIILAVRSNNRWSLRVGLISNYYLFRWYCKREREEGQNLLILITTEWQADIKGSNRDRRTQYQL